MKKKPDVTEQLLEILERNAGALDSHYWIKESMRNEELLFCFINALKPDRSAVFRKTIENLSKENWLEPYTLAKIEGNKEAYDRFIKIIIKSGASKKEAVKTGTVLITVSKIIYNKYQGKIQSMLRIFGEVLKKEMMQTFKTTPLSKRELDFAVTHWLQNVLNIPLSFNHPLLWKFCRKHKITFRELTEAADEIDLNIAVLDDIIISDSK